MVWMTKPDGSRVWVWGNDIREWLEEPLPGFEEIAGKSRATQAPAGAAPKPHLPDAVRQHLSEIGRRGGLERSRRFSQRNVRALRRFWQRYGCNPNQVKAALVSATVQVLPYLRALASLGGRARARKYSREQLKVWAAEGGRAKAAKSKRASSPAQAVAGKQE